MILRQGPYVQNIAADSELSGKIDRSRALVAKQSQLLLQPVKICLIPEVEGYAGVREGLPRRDTVHERRGREDDDSLLFPGQSPEGTQPLDIEQVARDVRLIKEEILGRIERCLRIIKTEVLVKDSRSHVIFRDDKDFFCIKRQPINHMGFLCVNAAGQGDDPPSPDHAVSDLTVFGQLRERL